MISCLLLHSLKISISRQTFHSSRERHQAVDMAVKRKVPVRPERDVPALANVRAFVSSAQENIL
jgi:hypothetical protein